MGAALSVSMLRVELGELFLRRALSKDAPKEARTKAAHGGSPTRLFSISETSDSAHQSARRKDAQSDCWVARARASAASGR